MGLEDDIGKLARIPAFAAIEPEALRLIAFSAETRILRAGDVLFRRDEMSNGGFVVLAGSIAMDASGDGAAPARIVRPPGLIGDLALLTQTRRPATAIAREPSTVLRHFAAAFPSCPAGISEQRGAVAAIATHKAPAVHRRTWRRAPREPYLGGRRTVRVRCASV